MKSFLSKPEPGTKDLQQEIELLQQQIKGLEKENLELEQSYFHQFDRNTSEKSISEFYDGVIDIPNLRSLHKGWEVHVKDWDEYKKLVQGKGIVVSIVGNYGKGKTFLLGLLSDQETPHGFNVNTQGISIRYLRDKLNNKIRPVIVLDTKGGSLPLDVSEAEEKKRSTEEPRATNMLEEQIEEENWFKQILRDHDATEDVLQNFITEEANIIILVVSDLTFPDQRLITKIKNKFRENESKQIIVVHNLYHAKTKKDVENKLKDFIFRSFKLTQVEFREFQQNKNSHYYVEKGKNNMLIHHLILAKQSTEAGDYYNDVTVKHIKACIDANGYSKLIDVIESFHRYLKNSLQSYIETQPQLESDHIKLEKNENSGSKAMKIIMPERQSLKVKAVMTDELGHLRIFKDSTEFQPKYCLFEEVISSTESYLCMKVECPDGKPDFQYRVQHNTDEFSIQLRGFKHKDKTSNTNLADTRESGQFFVETEMHRKSKYRFDYDGIYEQPQRTYVDGMIVLKWKLRPLNDTKVPERPEAATPVTLPSTPLNGSMVV